MRIALVCPYSLDVPGGVGTHTLGLARWLVEEGHDAFVVAPGRREVDRGVPVHLLGDSRAFAFNGSTANLAVRPAQARRARDLVADADVVHVHEPLTPGIAYAAARAARRLVVTHHASFTVPSAAAWVLRRRAARLGPRTSIAVSAAAAETARLVAGITPTIIPNAITLPPAAPKLTGAIPTVLFVGRRDDPRKGYPVFARMAELLAGRARFVAVGPGGDRDGREGAVELLPQATDAELSDQLRGARVVVAPNLGGESFGLVLVEALAHGCSLVASELPAFRDVLGDADVVTWFRPGDADAGARALAQRLALPPDVSGARAIAERFSWEVVGPRVLRQYRSAPLS
ncbi:MAG: glycosyltransferase family 4 protein [Propionibacterium sp.]|nr:glycosyltransferase family 4 protein [Propionibacterium sp.]